MEYTEELETQIRQWVRQQMKSRRYKHVKGVVKTADSLAQLYAPDEAMRCRLAAWLHDAAKSWPDEALLAYAQAHDVEMTETEQANPMLLHGIVGYLIGAQEFGLDDPVIRSACALHTTGGPGMNAVDKIVFLADLIEPGREFKGVDKIREQAETDLDSALLLSINQTMKYLVKRDRIIDPRWVLLRNELIRDGVKLN